MFVLIIIMVVHLATDIVPSLKKGDLTALKAIHIPGADLGAGMGFRVFGRVSPTEVSNPLLEKSCICPRYSVLIQDVVRKSFSTKVNV